MIAICARYILVPNIFPASILYKSIAGRYRPVSYPDGPITARYKECFLSCPTINPSTQNRVFFPLFNLTLALVVLGKDLSCVKKCKVIANVCPEVLYLTTGTTRRRQTTRL